MHTSNYPVLKPKTSRSGYLPSLDGWRAIAIFGVLLTHSLKWTFAGHALVEYQNIGGMGVNLFFAISGILITTRILVEESLCGFFDIKKFYIRRIFRIQPAAWAYLAVIAILLGTHCITTLWKHWFGALGMYENFIYQGAAYDYKGFFVGHFWSLAVEEHFYILLSLFLLTIRKRRLTLLASAFLCFTLFKLYAIDHGFATDVTIRRTYYQLPNLLYGACFAVALQMPRFRNWALKYVRPWIVFLITVSVVLIRSLILEMFFHTTGCFRPSGLLSAAPLLCDYMFAIWVVSTMLTPGSLATKVLEWAPIRWIGRISYSLYLWHVLFFFPVSPHVKVTLPILLALSHQSVKYFAAVVVAATSYYLIEKPCMRMGHRLAPPVTPGRPELAEKPELNIAPTPAV